MCLKKVLRDEMTKDRWRRGGGGTLEGGDALEMEALVDAMEVLIMDEKDDELVICIWREFIRRVWFENGMSLN
ncbi:hypothetical protein Tco_0066576 [Tanacetum coccineum]